jgi:hypothetical protein
MGDIRPKQIIRPVGQSWRPRLLNIFVVLLVSYRKAINPKSLHFYLANGTLNIEKIASHHE